MNARDKGFNFRPESVKLTNEINTALEPLLNKALKWGFSLDAFYYLVNSELNDIINMYAQDHRKEN